MKISEIYEDLIKEEEEFFSLNIDQETGIPSVIKEQNTNNFSAIRVLEFEVIPPSESPFEKFSIHGNHFEQYKNSITNEIFGIKPMLEAQVDTESYNLLSSKITTLIPTNSVISCWYEPDEEYTYILFQSTSEEEQIFGYLSMLIFCRIEK